MFEALMTDQTMAGWFIAGIMAIGLVGVKLMFMHKDKKREEQYKRK